MYDTSLLFDGFGQMALDVVYAVIPLLLVFLLAQAFVLKLASREVRQLATGFAIASVGLLLFLQGVHVTYIPLGQDVGQALMDLPSVWWSIPVGFLMGFVATVAEPAVRILNDEVQKVSANTISRRLLLMTLSVGVGLSVALALARIILDMPLWYILLPGYGVALIGVLFLKEEFVALAFDAGGVATGPMTVTFIVAVGVGAAADLADRDPLIDGFGLVALVALTPILSMLVLGAIYGAAEREGADMDEDYAEGEVKHEQPEAD